MSALGDYLDRLDGGICHISREDLQVDGIGREELLGLTIALRMIKSLHVEVWETPHSSVCDADGWRWPCPTARILAAVTEEQR